MPALQEVGLVGINETGSLLAGARVRDIFSRDPPLAWFAVLRRAGAQSQRCLRPVFATLRCAHTGPFARLDGPSARVGRLVFGPDAALLPLASFLFFLIGLFPVLHGEALQGSERAAPRHMLPDSRT